MIRIITLNLWQEQGPWQKRIELCIKRFAALSPDVICLQEVREVPKKIPNQAMTLAEALRMEVTFEPAQSWGGGEEGLAILSRFSMIEREAIELPSEKSCRRICLAAQLAAPAGAFWVYTTHLAWRMTDGLCRERQVLALDQFVKAHPTETSSILTGDFNATPFADEMRFLRGLTTLEGKRTYYQDAFALCHPGMAGWTWTQENPYTKALDWLEQDRRLDYIWVTPRTRKGAGAVKRSQLVLTKPDERGIYCSDHYGVLAEVEIAAAHQ